MMNLTINITGKDRAELLKGLQAHLTLLGGAGTTTATETKTTKPAKRAAAVETEEEEVDLDGETEEEDEADLSDSEDDEEETEESDEEETEEEDEAPSVSLQDVIGAFQKYAKKHSREDAAKVLKKFKAKSVRDLKADQYTAVMTALKK